MLLETTAPSDSTRWEQWRVIGVRWWQSDWRGFGGNKVILDCLLHSTEKGRKQRRVRVLVGVEQCSVVPGRPYELKSPSVFFFFFVGIWGCRWWVKGPLLIEFGSGEDNVGLFFGSGTWSFGLMVGLGWDEFWEAGMRSMGFWLRRIWNNERWR